MTSPSFPAPNDPRHAALTALAHELEGTLEWDDIHRMGYATDASAYREWPLAVAFPKHTRDLQTLVHFASHNGIPLIPRAAGTSLAGQVVGSGIVVDVSRHFTRILEVNVEERWVRVQPGVIRDELNQHLKPYGLLFGPETSTSNRAMIGGMVGNNSCGSNSVKYGSTREHLLEVKALLSNGSEVTFEELSPEAFEDKVAGRTTSSVLEQRLYLQAKEVLGNEEQRQQIREHFPKPEVSRRNHGYALDLLMDSEVFEPNRPPFNFCRLLAGSEGTLALTTEIKLSLQPLPPPVQGLLCAHFHDLYEALESTLIALEFRPGAVELMDHYILECTRESKQHRKNRFFIEGEPQALLVVQWQEHSLEAVQERALQLTERLKARNYGYHYPLLTGEDCAKVWSLRKAGLGLLSNIPGDAKPVPVIEDTAVAVEDLPAYIREFNALLREHNLSCVHYAHAGSGELHLRPILDLKTAEGTRLFRTILEDVADLVKRYRGSLSGEHGDGRLRAELLPHMVGPELYELFREIKNTWDEQHLFNPGKIVDAPPMDTSLRYYPDQVIREIPTVFRFDTFHGYQRTAELCNGSGDCRKTELTGGTMCPSYMATRDEMKTTRARANVIREVFTYADRENPFDSPEIKQVLDTCISCKGCTSECPSSVDMTRLKTEFEHQYQQVHGIPKRTWVVAHFSQITAKFVPIAPLVNAVTGNRLLGGWMKRFLGMSTQRSLPRLARQTVRQWYKRSYAPPSQPQGAVYLFLDEFTDLQDVSIGKAAVQLLSRLGYEVRLVDHMESGRASFSKGLLLRAKRFAEANVRTFAPLVTAKTPLIGLEPSALLSFRDEYPDLVDEALAADARALSPHCLLLEEFISREVDAGRIQPEQFHTTARQVRIHGHCHQKALSNVGDLRKVLSLPSGYEARLIPSGCCGMAGSFGYENEHYDLSMQIGELVLFPAVRDSDAQTIIAAPGTSCRHQILDGTGRLALHPAEILYEALRVQ